MKYKPITMVHGVILNYHLENRKCYRLNLTLQSPAVEAAVNLLLLVWDESYTLNQNQHKTFKCKKNFTLYLLTIHVENYKLGKKTEKKYMKHIYCI